jgi:DNA-binding transcriptional regulator LsrR (DeoR family)/DNA-binding XRE family transcriptional regulator
MKKNPDLRQEFGNRLSKLRNLHDLTQAEAARRVEVGATAWAAYEQGVSAPSLETLIRIADLLKTSIDQLVGRDPEPSTSAGPGGVKWQPVWKSGPKGNDALAVQAWQRVIQGQTIAQIGDAMHLERHRVDDMLGDLIFQDRIELLEVGTDREGKRLKEHFTVEGRSLLRDAWVAGVGHVRPAWVRMVLLGHTAKEYFKATVRAGDTIALCGGFAVSRLVCELRRGDIPYGVTVVPLAASPMFEEPNVSANGLVSALAYRHYRVQVKAEELPPCLGGDAPGGPAVLIAKRVLDRASRADVVFLGIGAAETGALAKNLLDVRADYHHMAGLDLSSLRDKSKPKLVGNIAYYLVDETGRPPEDFRQANENLVISIGLSGLEEIVKTGGRVVILAAGKNKAAVVNAAVRSGRANALVVDSELAAELLAMGS